MANYNTREEPVKGLHGDPNASGRGFASSANSNACDEPHVAKSQPWKKFWPPGGEHTNSKSTAEDQLSPWLNWKPDPNHPDAKPWIQWLNDKKFNSNFDEKSGKYMYPVRKRGKSAPSPRATVAEGG